MLKHRYTRVAILTVGILFLLSLVFIPRSFKTEFKINQSDINLKPSEQVETTPSDEEFEKLEKPVYFSIFKFITGFIPTKHKQTFF